ncbi:MAG: DNA polymerase III subunit gamma/tau [Acidobacteria bacterium]|nr:DNA polymerase III subunit gamma/tau [Acidobacteriota bacterium]
MSYQVLARKWRPQRFEEVVGQRGVTQTLANAIAAGRIAQAFVFAGPRGVGKTTTARILARALNCDQGPTPDPCGACDACVEIAGGRDIDVLEIDAATHTGIDNVREVIIAGLAIRPSRDRYKVFIIDEAHQLSGASFNALLKSIEEPPPHVAFVMATTALERVPDTILSRSQVFEFRAIAVGAIAEQLRRIGGAERLSIDDAAVALIARAAEGSMRDAQSALDQVIAFAGEKITEADVALVLGLVGRDLLLDIVQAVADEDAPALFALAGRAVESGYDLRLVCRELARVARDLLVISFDPSRLADPEIAREGERDRLQTLARRFSREDLMRAFDLLTEAEADIRVSAQPRYQLEMALVRWVHLRKLVPLEQVIEELKGGPGDARGPSGPRSSGRPVEAAGRPSSAVPRATAPPQSSVSSVSPATERPAAPAPKPRAEAAAPENATRSEPASGLKAALLAEVMKTKRFLYNTVVAQAQKIEVAGDSVVFTFAPIHRPLQAQLDQNRLWLESVASELAGRRIAVATNLDTATPRSPNDGATPEESAEDRKSRLTAEALSDPGVQSALDIFGGAIRDVEEL